MCIPIHIIDISATRSIYLLLQSHTLSTSDIQERTENALAIQQQIIDNNYFFAPPPDTVGGSVQHTV